MSAWELEEIASRYVLQNRWEPIIMGGVRCSVDYPDSIALKHCASQLLGVQPGVLRREIACMMRAPWIIFRMHMEGQPKVNQDTVLAWYNSLGANALKMKPSEFIQAYPTFTDGDGEQHPMAAVFAATEHGGGHRMEYEFAAEFKFFGSDGNTHLFPAAYDMLYIEPQFAELGLKATLPVRSWKPQKNNTFRITLDAESDTFEGDLDNFVSFLVRWGRDGLHFPFTFSWLPNLTDMVSVEFRIQQTARLLNFNPFDTNTHVVTVGILDYEGRRIDKMNMFSLDWQTYVRSTPQVIEHSGLQVCLEDNANPNQMVTSVDACFAVISGVRAVVAAVRPVCDAVHESNRPHGLLAMMDAVTYDIARAQTLMLTGNNLHLMKSEGILQIENVVDRVHVLLDHVREENIGTVEQRREWAELVTNNVNLKKMMDDATEVGYWKESYRSLPRPLHEHAKKDWEGLVGEVAEIRTRRERGGFPPWVEIVMCLLGAMIVGAAVYAAYSAIRK